MPAYVDGPSVFPLNSRNVDDPSFFPLNSRNIPSPELESIFLQSTTRNHIKMTFHFWGESFMSERKQTTPMGQRRASKTYEIYGWNDR